MKVNPLFYTVCAALSVSAFNAEAAKTSTGSGLDQPRIIDGEPAEQHEFPFMTALVRASNTASDAAPFCGASFIGGRYVLTAAHCLENIHDASDVDVVIGQYKVSDPTNGQRYSVAQFYLHEQYGTGLSGINNDIAILELEQEVTGVTPINIADSAIENTINTGDMLTVMGWGNQSTEAPSFPDILHKVNVPLVDQASCNESYDGEITDQMLCAGFEQGGKDSCQGDSGGPLIINRNDQYYQVGIVSFGEGCALAGYPGVYARVSQFVDWVTQKKAGVSYRQRLAVGYVENDFEEVLTFSMKNVGDTDYQVSGISFDNIDNAAQPEVITNGCSDTAISQGQSCEFTVKVAADQTGVAQFAMNVATTHPGNNLATHFVSYKPLEPFALPASQILDTSNPDIQWYSGGDQIWSEQTTYVAAGNSALESGVITHRQQSVLLGVMKSNRSTNFAFQYRVEAEDGYDGLSVFQNGKRLNFFATGVDNTEFQSFEVPLTDGNDRIAIVYEKDTTDEDEVGADKAWVDAVNSTFTNRQPTISVAGSNLNVKAKNTLTLNASATADPDGDSLSYQWEIVGDALNSTIANATAATASLTAGSKAGTVTLKLTVTDQYGLSATQNVPVTIQKSGGSGGTMNLFLLLLSGLMISIRRYAH